MPIRFRILGSLSVVLVLALLAGCGCTKVEEPSKPVAVSKKTNTQVRIPMWECGTMVCTGDCGDPFSTGGVVSGGQSTKMIRDQALRDERARQLRTERRLYRPGGFTLKGIVAGSPTKGSKKKPEWFGKIKPRHYSQSPSEPASGE